MTPAPSSARPLWLCRAAIALAVAVAYHAALPGEYVLDDQAAVVNNERLRDLGDTVRALPSIDRPFTELTFALSYAIGGMRTTAFRLPNLVAHAAAALLLFGLVRITLGLPRFAGRFATSAIWLATTAALLWAVHPLASQAVVYVCQRSQVLAGVFMLGTLYCLARGATAERRRGWWYAVAVASAMLAIGSKQDAVVLPVLAVLYDRIFLAGSWRGVARRWAVHLPIVLTLLALAGSVQFAFRGLEAVGQSAPAPGVDEASDTAPISAARPTAGFVGAKAKWWQYALTQSGVVLHYLRLAAWPHPLCFDYQDWPVATGLGDVALPVVAIIGLLLSAGVLLWRRPEVGFLAAWVFVTLAPTSSVMPIDDVAVEHRMYSPLMAVVVPAVILGWEGLSRFGVNGRRVAIGLAIAGIVAGVAGTFGRVADYHTGLTMWQSVLQVRPGNSRAHNNLAVALVRAGRLPEAVPHFERAVELRPSPSGHARLAQALIDTGRLPEAVRHLRAAVDSDGPKDEPRGYLEAADITPFKLRYNLATGLSDRGEWEEAISEYRQAIRLNPTAFEPRLNLSRPLIALGRWQEAADTLEEAIRIRPGFALGHNNLGLVLCRLGRTDDALREFKQAVECDPNCALCFNNWGATLVRAGDPRAAADVFARGLACRPTHPQLLFARAHALGSAGDARQSADLYAQARRTAPALPAQFVGSAWALATNPKAELRDPVEAIRLAEMAVQATDRKLAEPLDAAAAAYASAGRFDEAVVSAEKAVALSTGQPQKTAAIKARVEMYRRREAFTQPVP